jgi:hypothetical protein
MRRWRSRKRLAQRHPRHGPALAGASAATHRASPRPSVPETSTASPGRARTRPWPGRRPGHGDGEERSRARVTLPPTTATRHRRAQPARPRSIRPARRGPGPASPGQRPQRRAPMAAGRRFTASAFQPTSSAAQPRRKCTLHHRVHRQHQPLAAGRGERRRVVADAHHHALAPLGQPPGEELDERELADGPRQPARPPRPGPPIAAGGRSGGGPRDRPRGRPGLIGRPPRRSGPPHPTRSAPPRRRAAAAPG